MQLKEWIKSDLIYEFDADELGLEVKEINGVQWFEKNHLEEAKRQVFRLIDFVEKDFGFPSSEISLNFSGKAGFHVHFRSEKIQTLNKKARIELVDYLTAHNIDYINLGINFETLSFPKPAGLWQKRIIEGVKEFFMQDTKRICAVTGFAPKKVSPLVRDKSALLDSLTKGVLMQVEGRKSGEFWKKVLDFVVAKERCPIDRQTSVDLHKIIRVPATLHGETGFLAKTIPLESLKDFNPFNDAVAFGNEKIKVRVIECPAFELNSQSFGPFKDSVEELPLFAAVYLIGKGSALLL
jgi:DNA primase small subunit